MRAGNSSIPPEGLRQGLHTEEIRQGAIERTTASNSLAPASRTKSQFQIVSRHVNFPLPWGFRLRFLTHTVSGRSMMRLNLFQPRPVLRLVIYGPVLWLMFEFISNLCWHFCSGPLGWIGAGSYRLGN